MFRHYHAPGFMHFDFMESAPSDFIDLNAQMYFNGPYYNDPYLEAHLTKQMQKKKKDLKK